MSKPFIHLHVHTEYSLLDGAARLLKDKKSPLMKACVEKNMPAIAITDHGAMFGVYTFQKLAISNGVQPIIGCELYICEDMYDKTNKIMHHILLLAKDNDGYKNLVKLDSIAYTEGFYYKPRIDMKFLKEHAKGLICTTACIGGTVSQHLLRNEYDKARDHAIVLRDTFEEGDFYIEIQDHGIPEEKLCNPLLVKIAREIGVKVVATNDVHYIEKEDAEMHDVLLCIQTRRKINDSKRMKFTGSEFYLKTYEEMEKLFSWCPESLETPFEIAAKCKARIEKKDLMPPYFPESGQTPAEFLRTLGEEGLVQKYGELTDEIKERFEYELGIIIRMGFCEYYLIVWDFIDYARRNDIPVGAGRGSGVGSIIAYAVGITNVDPLKYNLLFERFLNPERVSNPDFDIDFCVDGRGQIIEYVIEKYGADKVCQILALGTLATKNAIKDVARVYEVPLSEVNALTKLIPAGKVKLGKILGFIPPEKDKPSDLIPEIRSAYDNNPEMKKVLEIAMKIEGMPRNCSKHAAGVVICKEVISDFVPLSRSGEDITTQFQKDEVEEVGMLKMDFLGLRTLTDIKKAKQYVRETTGRIIDFDELGSEDPNVYKLIGSGETDAVFQLESPGMKKFMKQLQPTTLEDIIAGISLYRPGPMDSIPQYVDSKNFPENIKYLHPLLEPILNMTYGCLVYQEQVMQVVQKLAGYTFGRADILRRAMGKKNKELMAKERAIFVSGSPAKETTYNSDGTVCSKAELAVVGAFSNGVPVEIGNKIFDIMMNFASYAFNKSHAAAYAVCSYETAFLKCYYPVQYLAAVINNRITNQDEISKYVEYLRYTKIQIYPPDINKSNVYFSCETENMRYGLMGIKNVGDLAIHSVVREREENGDFKSIHDFIRRCDKSAVNKRMIESLIKAGAFDVFGETRATLLVNYESIILLNNHDKKISQSGQLTMFEMLDEDVDDSPLIKVEEYPRNEVLSMEKEMLNIYMSGHPLDEYRELYSTMYFTLNSIKPLIEMETITSDSGDEEDTDMNADVTTIVKDFDKKQVELGGMISDVRIRPTKNGKTMAIVKLEDLYDSIDIVIFPNSYDKCKHLLEKDKIVKVSGELQVAGRPQIIAQSIKEWGLNGEDVAIAHKHNNQTSGKSNKLYINVVSEDDAAANEVLQILNAYPGVMPCILKFRGKALNSGVCVQDTSSLYLELASVVGEKNYKKV